VCIVAKKHFADFTDQENVEFRTYKKECLSLCSYIPPHYRIIDFAFYLKPTLHFHNKGQHCCSCSLHRQCTSVSIRHNIFYRLDWNTNSHGSDWRGSPSRPTSYGRSSSNLYLLPRQDFHRFRRVHLQRDGCDQSRICRQPHCYCRGEKRVVRARQKGYRKLFTTTSRRGQLKCDIQFKCSWGKTLNWNSCTEGMAYLRGLGQSMCRVGGGYGNMARVSCSSGCGIYLSNKVRLELPSPLSR
jgi:hypothetical protein